MASEKPKRNIADFFRPSAKVDLQKSIPAKRPSPSATDGVDGVSPSKGKQLKRNKPQTPSTATRLKDAFFSPYRSPLGPRSGTSVTIPIRTPKANLSQESPGNFTPSASISWKTGLFTSATQKSDQEVKPLSFADVPTTAQSVVKDGKVIAVRSSDDEDSDSLCSLDDILGRTRHDVPTASSSPPDVGEGDEEAERSRTLSMFTHGRSDPLIGRDKLRQLATKASGLNFDMNSLVGDHFDDEEIEANVTKAKKGYKASDDHERLKRQGMVDKQLLASVMSKDDSGDNLQRLFNAVERTEALATDHGWSMFDPGPNAPKQASYQPFPEACVEPDLWYECLKEPDVRNRAYLSGYIAEKAREELIPDDIVTWTYKNITWEPRDDLRKSYVQVVTAASSKWTSINLTSGLIEELFCQLGADPTMVACDSNIIAEPQVHSEGNSSRKTGLLSAMEMLIGLSMDMTQEALSSFVKLLMRLAIDTKLMVDSRICITVEKVISALLSRNEERVSISVAKCILQDLSLRVRDPFLQTQSLKHILPVSTIAASLRVRLATLFLVGADFEDNGTLDFTQPEIVLTQLISHLHERHYDISPSNRQKHPFNYGTLSSLIYIFDVALANGGRPSRFPSPSHERDFNHDVDSLADRIKSIITSIADTGASHMRRTEAKEALNALHFRLLYGVRTKPRPKKSVFGGRDGPEYRAEGRSAGMMQQFLERREEQKDLPRESDANADRGGDVGKLT